MRVFQAFLVHYTIKVMYKKLGSVKINDSINYTEDKVKTQFNGNLFLA